jgi:hypothetical protein
MYLTGDGEYGEHYGSLARGSSAPTDAQEHIQKFGSGD